MELENKMDFETRLDSLMSFFTEKEQKYMELIK